MRHGMSGRKLGRTTSHRQALFANMATSLLKHGQIRTTLPKAKELRRIVDPLITLGKRGDLSARRKAAQTITEPEVVKYLFNAVAPAMKSRQGGYTRVLRAGFRNGDNAEMAVIQLSDKPETAFDGEQGQSEQAAKGSEGKASSDTAKEAKKPAAKAKEKTSPEKAAESNKEKKIKAESKSRDSKATGKKEEAFTAQQTQTKSKSSK